MQVLRLPDFSRAVLVLLSGFFGATASAAAAPEFAITATNVSMPASGLGFTHYTVTAVPMTGTLEVSCQYAGTNPEAKVPICTYGPVHAPTPVNAGQTVTGMIYFYPSGSGIPADSQRRGDAPVAGLALAGLLMLGIGVRRGARGWLALTMLLAGTLAGVVGISACDGGSMSGMTPGTYAYTLTAGNEASGNAPLGQGTTTTIIVTVP